MAVALRIPDVGSTVALITVSRWLKRVGDRIRTGEAVVEIQADKGVAEIDAQVDGVLLKILAAAGDTVEQGHVVAIIGRAGEDLTDLAPESLEIDDAAGANILVPDQTEDMGALPRHQAVVAGRVRESQSEKATIRVNAKIDMTHAMVFMEDYKKEHAGIELRYDDLFIFALGRIISKWPEFRSYIRGQNVIRHQSINIGFAVSIAGDLFIPVVREADRKAIDAISTDIERLVNKAFDHTLSPYEMANGCIIVSNLGMYPIDSFDAIIYPEHSAALAIGSINKIPVVVEDEIAIRPIMKAALTVDHRLINGMMAAQFLTKFKKFFEKDNFSC